MAGSENAQYGFFKVDGPHDGPMWIIASDVEAISSSSCGNTAIHMKSGTTFYTETETGETLERVNEALK